MLENYKCIIDDYLIADNKNKNLIYLFIALIELRDDYARNLKFIKNSMTKGNSNKFWILDHVQRYKHFLYIYT